MIRALPLLWLACVADDPRPGTFVGNPGKLALSVIDVDPGLTLDAAQVEVVDLRLEGCDGTSGTYDLDRAFDALGGGADAVTIPGGSFCGVDLLLDPVAPVSVSGTTAGGTTFSAVLDPGPLSVAGSFEVDGEQVLVSVSLAALDPAALDALGPDVSLDASDPLAQAVAEGVSGGVGLFEDVDRDGVIGAPDHPALLDTGFPTADALGSQSAGCSCASGPGAAAPWWLVALLSLAATRARRGSPRPPPPPRRPATAPWPSRGPG